MTEWTPERLLAQGYQADPDPSLEERNSTERMVSANALHRDLMLPCSQPDRKPLAEKPPFTPQTEAERLFPDQERVKSVLAARKALGL